VSIDSPSNFAMTAVVLPTCGLALTASISSYFKDYIGFMLFRIPTCLQMNLLTRPGSTSSSPQPPTPSATIITFLSSLINQASSPPFFLLSNLGLLMQAAKK